MTETYTPLYTSILDSSVWDYDLETRIVWVTMIAMVDKDGFVHAAVPGIAQRARVSIQAVEKALKIFQEPDPYSRDADNDGRRVKKQGRDWVILNHHKHRIKTYQERESERKKEYYEKQKAEKSNNCAYSRTLAQTRAIGADQIRSDQLKTNIDNIEQSPIGQDIEDDSLNGQVVEKEKNPLKSPGANKVYRAIRANWPDYSEQLSQETAARLYTGYGKKLDLLAIIKEAAIAWKPGRSVHERNGLHGYLAAFVSNGWDKHQRQAQKGSPALPDNKPNLAHMLGNLEQRIRANQQIELEKVRSVYNEAVEDGINIPSHLRSFVNELQNNGIIELNRIGKIEAVSVTDPATPSELRKGGPEVLGADEISKMIAEKLIVKTLPDEEEGEIQ